MSNRKTGFTLIEMIVVITIVGLLASAVTVGFGRQRAKSRDARRIADMSNARTAAESYIGERGNLPQPSTSENCGWDMSSLPTSNPDFMKFLVDAGYLQNTLKDPINEIPTTSTPCETAFNYYYHYYIQDSGTYGFRDGKPAYLIKANLEVTTLPQEAERDDAKIILYHEAVN